MIKYISLLVFLFILSCVQLNEDMPENLTGVSGTNIEENDLTIVRDPQNVTVTSGGTALFSVVATGTDLSYQWKKNGIDVGDNSSSYSFTAGTSDDGAVVTCVVSDSKNSITTNPATVTVSASAIAPAITTQPAGVTVSDGGSASFTVVASGTDLTYQWKKDGSNVGSNSPSYSFSAANSDDGAVITCVVSNSQGSVTSDNAVVTVTSTVEAPSITTQPEGVTVSDGNSASFTIGATGTDLSYQWKKDGSTVGDNSSSYSFTVTAADDGAVITCVVSNSEGSVTSDDAVVSVTTTVEAPAITTQPEGTTVSDGGLASFSIVVSGADLTYQWKKDGSNVGSNSPSYSFTAVTADDGAVITCVVSNSEGSVTSDEAVVSVSSTVEAPSITTQPAGVTVSDGGTASFSISASGTDLDYQWKKDGLNVGSNNPSYSFTASSSDDGAVITCVVSNSEGSVTSDEAVMSVTSTVVAPSISTQPVGVTVSEGTSASFSIVASGTNLTYQWKKDGSNVGSNSTSYSFIASLSDDDAVITCVVSNSEGTVTSSDAVVSVTAVVNAPSITTHPGAVTVTEGNSASFSIVASGTDLSYQWKKNGLNVGSNSSSYSFTAAAADDGAVITCVVSNSDGSATSNDAVVTVETASVEVWPNFTKNFYTGHLCVPGTSYLEDYTPPAADPSQFGTNEYTLFRNAKGIVDSVAVEKREYWAGLGDTVTSYGYIKYNYDVDNRIITGSVYHQSGGASGGYGSIVKYSDYKATYGEQGELLKDSTWDAMGVLNVAVRFEYDVNGFVTKSIVEYCKVDQYKSHYSYQDSTVWYGNNGGFDYDSLTIFYSPDGNASETWVDDTTTTMTLIPKDNSNTPAGQRYYKDSPGGSRWMNCDVDFQY